MAKSGQAPCENLYHDPLILTHEDCLFCLLARSSCSHEVVHHGEAATQANGQEMATEGGFWRPSDSSTLETMKYIEPSRASSRGPPEAVLMRQDQRDLVYGFERHLADDSHAAAKSAFRPTSLRRF